MPSIGAAPPFAAETRVVWPGAGAPLAAPDAGDSPSSPDHGASSPAGAGNPLFAKVLRNLGREVQRGESLMRGAMAAGQGGLRGGAGSSLDPADLIALQAGVYHYAEAIDLASKLVDRATSSVKTVLQG